MTNVKCRDFPLGAHTNKQMTSLKLDVIWRQIYVIISLQEFNDKHKQTTFTHFKFLNISLTHLRRSHHSTVWPWKLGHSSKVLFRYSPRRRLCSDVEILWLVFRLHMMTYPRKMLRRVRENARASHSLLHVIWKWIRNLVLAGDDVYWLEKSCRVHLCFYRVAMQLSSQVKP